MKFKKAFYFILFLIIFPIYSNSQNSSDIDSLRIELKNQSIDTLKLNIYKNIALHYLKVNLDSSLYYLKKSLEIGKNIDNKKYIIKTYLRIASLYFFKKDFIRSNEYLDNAENVLSINPINDNSLAYVYYYKAAIYSSLEEFKKAKKYADKSMSLFQKLRDYLGLSEIYSIYIKIYDGLHEYEQSLDYSYKAYRNDLNHNFKKSLPVDLNNISTRYGYSNEMDSAFFYIRQAINLNKKNNNPIGLSINYQNISKYYLNKKVNQLDSAEIYCNKALDIVNKLGNKLNLSKILILKGDIALARSDTNTAVLCFNRVIDTSALGDYSSLQSRISINEKLFNINIAKKNYLDAIKHFKQFDKLKDSLKNKTLVNLNSFFQMETERNKYKDDVTLLKKETHYFSYKRNFYITLIILLLALTIYIRNCYRKKISKNLVEKNKVQQELEFKKRELTIKAISQIKTNKILDDLTNHLFELSKEVKSIKLRVKVNKIITKINNCKNKGIMDEFIVRYKEVNPEFKQKLSNLFPDLSPSEFKVCMFLKLNLSTKEIAELLGVHPNTINNYRSKLRKKFNLPSDVSLFTFLSDIES